MKYNVVLRCLLSRVALRGNSIGLQAVQDTLMLLQTCANLLPSLIDFMKLVEIVLECRQGLLIYLAPTSIGFINVCFVELLRLVQADEVLLLVIDAKFAT